MKQKFAIFVLCLALCSSVNSQAQWYRSLSLSPAPTAAFDSFVSQPGITLAQVLDTVQSLLDPADTAEGGSLDQFTTQKSFWQGHPFLYPQLS